MRIVVCIKPVKSELVYTNVERNENFVINPYDLYALKNCIELKKETGCTVICVCMGSMGAEYLMTKVLAMNADEAILLNDAAFAGSDTVATTYVLSQAIKRIGNVDMVVLGEKSIDGETGQVVFGISERLEYFCVNKVEKLESIDCDCVVLKQNDGENITKKRLKLPLVVAFHDFELSQPDIGLVAIKRARHRGITVWNASDIEADTQKCGIYGSKTKVLDIKSNFSKKKNAAVVGTVADKTALIFNMVYGENVRDLQ